MRALELPMLLAAYHGGDWTAGDWLHPLLLEGVLTVLPYNGTYPPVGSYVVIAHSEQVGCVGRVQDVHQNFVMLREVWRPALLKYAMATEARLDAVARLTPRVPRFTSTEAADNWLRDARDLTVGDWVTWESWARSVRLTNRAEHHRHTATGLELEELSIQEGKLIAIDDRGTGAFDWMFWWENRPRARGRFKVVRINEDGFPQILEVHEIMRHER